MQIPKAFKPLKELCIRYKVLYGGRGAAKSHSIARVLLMLGAEEPLRIVCAREIMTSIADSVHRLLSDIIVEYDLGHQYTVYIDRIAGTNGTLILFKGLKHNVSGIKSLEGADICWVEEAENVTDSSWEVLIPTIRKDGSEIWVSFNTRYTSDPTYQRFVAHPTPDVWLCKVSYRDNPFFPAVLDAERRKLQHEDPEAYDHIWEGQPDTRRTGFVYAKQIAKARDDGRIGDFPYDPGHAVFTAWDLGFGDATAIWFFQVIGRGVRFIDHFANCGEQMDYYVREVLNERQYNYHRLSAYLPHDGAHGNIRGATPSRQLDDLGYKNIVLPKRSNGLSAEIELTRQVLGYASFNANTCREGLHSIEHYRYAWDDIRQIFKKTPMHDWASHDADALCHASMAVSQMKHVALPSEITSNPFRKQYDDSASWMGS